MNLTEFGEIVKYIRSEVLKKNQTEVSSDLKTTQAIISRLEKGKGCSINVFFSIMNYFMENGINAHMIFFKPFNPAFLNAQFYDINKDHLKLYITELTKNYNSDFSRLLTMADKV